MSFSYFSDDSLGVKHRRVGSTERKPVGKTIKRVRPKDFDFSLASPTDSRENYRKYQAHAKEQRIIRRISLVLMIAFVGLAIWAFVPYGKQEWKKVGDRGGMYDSLNIECRDAMLASPPDMR